MLKLPVSLSPNTSPSGSSSFSLNCPTIWSRRARFAGEQNLLLNTIAKNSSKCKENMQDGAIVHLTEDGMQNDLKVPDDHMTVHVHTPGFWQNKTCFFVQENFRIVGAFIFWSLDTKHHQLCTEQCPELVSKVSILLSTFIWPYSKFS